MDRHYAKSMHVNIMQLCIYVGLDTKGRNHKRQRSCYVLLINRQLILFCNKVIKCNVRTTSEFIYHRKSLKEDCG